MNDAMPALLLPPLAGSIDDLPAERYHAHEAMSASGAKKMLRSPMHYRLMRDTPNVPTDAMQFGTVCHTGVLEPHCLGPRVCVLPADPPRRPTKAQINAKRPSPETMDAIAWWQEFDAAAAGKIVMAMDEFQRATKCISAVLAHPAASKLLDGAVVERSLFWSDGEYKVPCKARFDAMNLGGVIDVKSTQDASPEGFARQAANLLYHVQAAHYCSAAEHVLDASPEFFAFICVESEPPHAVAVYTLPPVAIRAGARLMDEALARYRDALAGGTWPGYSETINPLELPRWALRDMA